MKDVGHAMAALLIQVETGLRGSERLVERARGYGDTV